MLEQADASLRTGHSVIADAVYPRAEERQAIERVAADASAPFVGLWLDAPEETLVNRTELPRATPRTQLPRS